MKETYQRQENRKASLVSYVNNEPFQRAFLAKNVWHVVDSLDPSRLSAVERNHIPGNIITLHKNI